MARRIALVLLSLVLLVVVLAGGALAVLAWRPDLMRGPLERILSAQVGQPVRIEGPMALDLGRIVTIELGGLQVAAPDWAEAPHLAAVERLRVGLDLGTYWREGRLRLTELRLEAPRVALERDAQGRTSWPAGQEQAEAPAEQEAQAPDAGGPGLPEIEALTINDGHLAYRDAIAEVAVEADLATRTTPEAAGRPGLVVDGQGTVRGDPLRLGFEVGAPAGSAQAAGTPLPIRGELTLAGTRLTLDGEVADPLSLAGLTLALDLASDDPRGLLALAGRPVEEALPPLSASARLTRPQAAFNLDPLRLGWGESRVEGRLSYDPSVARPEIAGELRSPLLDLAAVWPALTAGSPSPEPEPATGENPLAALAGHQGRLDLRADEVRLPQLALRDIAAGVRLADGRLTLEPVRLRLPEGGGLQGRIVTAPLDGPLAADLALDADRLDLAKAVPLDGKVAGRVTGRLAGTVRGGTEVEAILKQSSLSFEGGVEGLRAPYFAARKLDGTARLDGGRLTLEPVQATLAQDGRLAGRLASGPLDGPLFIEGDIDGERVPLAAFLHEEGGIEGAITGKLTGTAHVASLDAFLNQSRLRFDGSGRGLRLPQAELGEITGNARLEDGRLTLDPIRAALPQGRLGGRVVAGPFREGFTGEVALKGEGIDLAALAAGAPVAGTMQGELQGTLRGWGLAELLTQSELRLDGEARGLRLPQIEQPLDTATLRARLSPKEQRPLQATAEARIGDTPLRLDVRGGAAANLVENRGDYPLTVEAGLGQTRATADGSITLPLASGRFTAKVAVEGPDPGPVLALFQMPEVELPPYRLAGEVDGRGTRYRLANLDGRLGDSDIGGNLTLSLDGPRPAVSGELRSRLLDLDDFGGLVGAQPATGPGETASPGQRAEAARESPQATGQVIPDERLEPARWQQIDLDLAVAAAKVQAGKLPLDSFDLQVALQDGRLRLQPMVLRLGEGRVEGGVTVNASQAPVRADLELDMRRLPVTRLLNRLDVDVAAFGTLSGRARGGVGVGGWGLSPKQILGNADGEVTLVMEGGSIDRTIVTALGFDFLRLFGSFLGAAPEQVALRCTLADLAVRDGIVNTRALVMDTAIADLGGDGTINLETERIDIELVAQPEGAALPSGRTGIAIGGTLANPEINVDAATLAVRGAAATFGTLLTPFTAIVNALGGSGRQASPSACAEVLAGGQAG